MSVESSPSSEGPKPPSEKPAEEGAVPALHDANGDTPPLEEEPKPPLPPPSLAAERVRGIKTSRPAGFDDNVQRMMARLSKERKRREMRSGRRPPNPEPPKAA